MHRAPGRRRCGAGRPRRWRGPDHQQTGDRPPRRRRPARYRRTGKARRPADTGSMHRWFPAMGPGSPISVLKRSSSCINFGGRRWVRTTGFSLVRRKTARNTPSSPGRLMELSCENNAWRCPQVHGRVCTVVLASGSRSSLLTPRFKSELGPWRQAYRSRTRRMAGTPVRAPLDRWTGRRRLTELGTCTCISLPVVCGDSL